MQQALAEGRIEQDRYLNYLQILAEAAAEEYTWKLNSFRRSNYLSLFVPQDRGYPGKFVEKIDEYAAVIVTVSVPPQEVVVVILYVGT